MASSDANLPSCLGRKIRDPYRLLPLKTLGVWGHEWTLTAYSPCRDEECLKEVRARRRSKQGHPPGEAGREQPLSARSEAVRSLQGEAAKRRAQYSYLWRDRVLGQAGDTTKPRARPLASLQGLTRARRREPNARVARQSGKRGQLGPDLTRRSKRSPGTGPGLDTVHLLPRPEGQTSAHTPTTGNPGSKQLTQNMGRRPLPGGQRLEASACAKARDPGAGERLRAQDKPQARALDHSCAAARGCPPGRGLPLLIRGTVRIND